MLSPTGRARLGLRRYSSAPMGCPGGGYHNAIAYIGETRCVTLTDAAGEQSNRYPDAPREVPRTDARWPIGCERCDYVFEPEDEWQVWTEELYVRADTGEHVTIRNAAPGAMWHADWMPHRYRGPDGHCLVVRLPNGNDWIVDSRASNCDRPDDWQHRCWVRHGVPPKVTVGKNGLTCGAGAGSIQSGDYHGFLRNGVLEP